MRICFREIGKQMQELMIMFLLPKKKLANIMHKGKIPTVCTLCFIFHSYTTEVYNLHKHYLCAVFSTFLYLYVQVVSIHNW